MTRLCENETSKQQQMLSCYYSTAMKTTTTNVEHWVESAILLLHVPSCRVSFIARRWMEKQKDFFGGDKWHIPQS